MTKVMKPDELFKQWFDVYTATEHIEFSMEQIAAMWEGLSESYGYILDIYNNDEFMIDVNSSTYTNNQLSFIRLCNKHFDEKILAVNARTKHIQKEFDNKFPSLDLLNQL